MQTPKTPSTKPKPKTEGSSVPVWGVGDCDWALGDDHSSSSHVSLWSLSVIVILIVPHDKNQTPKIDLNPRALSRRSPLSFFLAFLFPSSCRFSRFSCLVLFLFFGVDSCGCNFDCGRSRPQLRRAAGPLLVSKPQEPAHGHWCPPSCRGGVHRGERKMQDTDPKRNEDRKI